MYGLRVYPGIHLFIGRCCDIFPPVMNRISLEAYPLLPFISPSFSLSLSLSPIHSLYLSVSLSLSPKAKLKYCIFKAPVLLSCCCSLSVSMMWKRLKVIPFLANPPHYVTFTLFYIWHYWNKKVCIWDSPSACSQHFFAK